MACFCLKEFCKTFASVSRLLMKCPFTGPVVGLHRHLMIIFEPPFHREEEVKRVGGGTPVPEKSPVS